MANKVLCLGASGTGKSTSIRNLDPETTLVIQAVKKRLPFRTKFTTFETDNYEVLKRALMKVQSDKKIKTVIIDDSQYLMANAFMRRANETGFGKFTQIGQQFWDLLMFVDSMDDDIDVFFLHHSEMDEGRLKAKTIGKMLDNCITLEGLFSIVIMTEVIDGQYYYRVNTSGNDTCKSPFEMFETELIENDLSLVKEAMKQYWG